MKYIFILLSVFCLSLQSSENKAMSLTIFVDEQSGQETCYTVCFQDEKECNDTLQEIAHFLSNQPPAKIAYSTEDSPPFIEKVWEEFLFTVTEKTFLASGSEIQYLSSSSFSTLPSMNGWGDPGQDPKPESPEAEPFFALRLTPKDKANISMLMTDLADKSYLQLLSNKNSMNRKGDRARVVPPLRFIGYILFDPYLHKCLRTISKDSLKYKEFVSGFEKRMEEDAAKEDLLRYAPGFAQLLQIDLKLVTDLIKKENYGDIVKKLL